jgi:hypothetical protein
VEALGRVNDPAVVVDILNLLLEKKDLFTLDISVALLPILNDLLSAQHEE